MATNEVYRNADHIPLWVPTGTKSGDPVAASTAQTLPGVAQLDRATGEVQTTVWLKGVFNLVVDGEITQDGTPVYIVADGTRQQQLVVAEPAADGLLFGYALEPKTAAAAAVPVRIAQV